MIRNSEMLKLCCSCDGSNLGGDLFFLLLPVAWNVFSRTWGALTMKRKLIISVERTFPPRPWASLLSLYGQTLQNRVKTASHLERGPIQKTHACYYLGEMIIISNKPSRNAVIHCHQMLCWLDFQNERERQINQCTCKCWVVFAFMFVRPYRIRMVDGPWVGRVLEVRWGDGQYFPVQNGDRECGVDSSRN